MKYVLVLLDGMADYKLDELGGKTPVQAADTPAMDVIASRSEIGRVRTVPDGYKPGSDVANLGVLGYDVRRCYTGRSPLEARAMGIEMRDGDLALLANLVTLSGDGDFEDKLMKDYSAGEISTEEARVLINDLRDYLRKENLMNGAELYAGTSYRHCMLIHGAEPNETLTPPHDITGKRIGEHLPKGGLSDLMNEIIKASHAFLSAHPINKARISEGKNPANSLWLWGEGTKPAIDSFERKYGKSGAMISAVDLLRGIAMGGGMKVVEVAGATGTINTNFDGKAEAAIRELESGTDFCMVHLEATDECGHQGNVSDKVRAIELIDQKVIARLYSHFTEAKTPFSMLIMPDHYTPLSTRTHSSEPVPYMLYTSVKPLGCNAEFSEDVAARSGILFEKPWELTERFFSLND